MLLVKALEESLKTELLKKWWGYSKEHGWIVLYWKAPSNRKKLVRIFVRCCDWETISVGIKDWGQPNFLYAPAYLRSIQDQSRGEAELNQLEKYREQAKLRLNEVGCKLITEEERRQMMLEAHKHFLQSRNIEYQGVRSTSKLHRVAYCWYCKGKLDSIINAECVACNWILCHCGACGCSYKVS
jgi:hypothetical protein